MLTIVVKLFFICKILYFVKNEVGAGCPKCTVTGVYFSFCPRGAKVWVIGCLEEKNYHDLLRKNANVRGKR